MLNKHTQAVVEAFRPLLRQCVSGEYGVAVGGAHAKGVDDRESDLDLYIFSGAALPNPERTRLVLQRAPDVHDVVSWGCVEPFGQAGTDFRFKDLLVECWFRNTASIERAINECSEGIVKRDLVTWTTTGFYNHCCLSDLNTMIPVDDAAGLLAGWKRRIREYPPNLRQAIIEQHLGAARFWPANFHYRSAIERQDMIYTTGIVQQVVHNLIQVLFAINDVYFPGGPVSVIVLREQQQELQELLKAVDAIANKSRW